RHRRVGGPGDVLPGGAVGDAPEVEQLDERQLARGRIVMREVVAVEHVLSPVLGDLRQGSAVGERSHAAAGPVLVDEAHLDTGGAAHARNRWWRRSRMG